MYNTSGMERWVLFRVYQLWGWCSGFWVKVSISNCNIRLFIKWWLTNRELDRKGIGILVVWPDYGDDVLQWNYGYHRHTQSTAFICISGATGKKVVYNIITEQDIVRLEMYIIIIRFICSTTHVYARKL